MKKVFKIITIVILVLGILFFGFLSIRIWQAKQLRSYVDPISSGLYSDLIQVENIVPNQTIQSPFTLTGQARGTWYFEASFPVTLVDLAGNTISQTFAQAKGEWMTENFVPFASVLNFEITTTTQPAILILHNDNASGLPENDKEISIPVILSNQEMEYRPVQLFYYNANSDKDTSGNILCSKKGLVKVERQIPITQIPIQDTIKLLLKGELTNQEKAQGLTTEYPLEGFSLKEASLNDGVLILAFNDLNNKTGGGSCRVGILWFQITETAKQFSEVSEVKFMPEELFQP